MPPSNAMENDKKRLRNQFTKDERTRLLAIMSEYGPLLDDKNISILSRKEIWEIIENKFNENGHSGRTSAQLKKYWQNYKYHSKRTKIIHKQEVPKPLSPMTKHMVRMLAKVNPEEWAQYDVAVSAGATKKSPKSSKPSPSDSSSGNSNVGNRERREESSSPMSKVPNSPVQRSSKSRAAEAFFTANDSRIKQENTSGSRSGVSESNVVVSTTDVPGSSVTVSVICPEVPSKARTIFWKRNSPPENICPMLQPSCVNEGERVYKERINFREDLPSDKSGDPEAANIHKNYPRRLKNAVGTLPGKESEVCGAYHQFAAKDDRLAKSAATPRANVCKNESPMNARGGETSLTNNSGLIGNVVGVGKEMARATARLAKDYNSAETLGSVSITKGRNEISKTKTSGVAGAPNPPISSRDNRIANDVSEEKGGADCPEFNEILEQLSKAGLKREGIPREARETIERLNGIENGYNLEEDSRQRRRKPERNAIEDLLRLRLPQSAGNRRFDLLRKFEPLISRMNSADKCNEENEETSDDSDPEKAMEVDEDSNRGKLRVRRVSLMTPTLDQHRDQRDVKIEAEPEPDSIDTPELPINENSEDNRVMNSMNYLVEVKLQSAESELNHQVKLQKLEMEEKELRVRIAEMTIQETRLRIQSLIEERRRATELHELRLAQMAAEKARSETEHAARLDATCVATAEGRARINSIERDRERSENFYQVQLRLMSGTSANGNCNVKCKHYQQ